jgi:PKD repeat protein
MTRGEQPVGARVSPESSVGRCARIALLAMALLAFTFAFALAAAPAGAVLARIGGHDYGVTPIRGVSPAALPAVKRAVASAPARPSGARPYDTVGQLVNHGGPVMHSVTTHVIYWDPSGEFTATTKGIVSEFFSAVAHDSGLASNVVAVAGQYGDGSGHSLYSSSLASEATDATAFPASGCTAPAEYDLGPPYTHCITDAQLQSELSTYVSAHGLPRGPTQQYFVFLPHRVVTCLPTEVQEGVTVHPCSNNYYCAYHSAINGGLASEIIYSDMPFSILDSGHAKACQFDGNGPIQHPNGDTTGGDETTKYADVVLKVTSHEYIEAATDPLGSAWWDTAGQEIGDKCNTTGTSAGEDPNAFLPGLGGSALEGTLFNQSINGGHFYLQSEWDNAAKGCLMRPVGLSGTKFTASPEAGTVGAAIHFAGAATDLYGGDRFTWSFGDGTEAVGAAAEHAYGAPGDYEVTMTARDEFTGSTAPPVVQTLVVDERPTAAFLSEPVATETGKPIKFNGAASSDPDGSITSYAWKFGDGGEGAGPAAEHAYATAGSYAVTLTVTDSGGQSATATQAVTVAAAAPITTAPITTVPITSSVLPTSAFTGAATFDATTGVLAYTATVGDPGTLKWLLTFKNGKFGVFAASVSTCRKSLVRLAGRCRPANVVFARGSKAVTARGTVKLTIRPGAAGLRALRNALRHRKGLPLTVTVIFQSSRGGSAVIHTRVLVVKLKKR